jgi:PPK2 family polyphosphate:nucleotide phosphotransferase
VTDRAKRLGHLIGSLRVAPGSTVALGSGFDPGFTPDWLERGDAVEQMQMTTDVLAEYQQRLAAQNTYGLLVVLQGIDGSGKDSTIRHVASGLNPAGVVVHSFKTPSVEELDHDYLWRYATRLPARGVIGIFNRSHYEEVLVVRVHPELLERQHIPRPLVHDHIWRRRYAEINDWERYLTDNGFRIVKLFLNVSKDEQRKRFLARIDEPDKNWKFSAADVQERRYWDDYQEAFSEMLSKTSTEWAPWYVIPADHKWFARIAVGAILAHVLAELDPKYPTLDPESRKALEEAGAALKAEGPVSANDS